eukprot:jgi/Ulvmu1/12828/UM098_0009.1
MQSVTALVPSGLRLCQAGQVSKLRRTTAAALKREQDQRSDPKLVQAARSYSEALDEGEQDEDKLVATIMGAEDTDGMTDVQQQYKDKIKAQIAKKAAELQAQEEAGREEFNFGVSLYERGRYADSQSMLQTALEVSGPFSKLGGDIQIQLALAMNANGKEQECIDLFRHLEETHPISAIARQAANLRFIMEAPKLEVGEDEKVSVPVLDLDSNKPRNSRQRTISRPRGAESEPPRSKTLEEEFWENYQPPSYMRNKYVWAAALIIGAAAAWYSIQYKDCIPM